ncbi:MAG: hypothetical protein NTW86_29035 [Candidatus Sumerlaeota bacterium]|nr:hypothetical protein [Candidatus Sumerlaeota bacterium]
MSFASRLAHAALLALWAGAGWTAARALVAESLLRAPPGKTGRRAAPLERAAQWDPFNAEAYAALGRDRAAKGEWRPAIEFYQKSLELRSDPTTAKRLAGACLQAGDIPRAQRAFETALLCAPRDREALYWLGYLSVVDLNAPDRAERLAKACLAHGEPTAEMRWVLGKAYELQGRYRQALHSFYEFLQLPRSPLLPEALYEKVDWRSWLGEWSARLNEVESGRLTPTAGQTVY